MEAQQLVNEANRLVSLGSLDVAMEAYHRSLQIHPTSTAHYNMANIYFQRSDRADARKHWQKSLSLDQAHADAHVNLGNLELLEGHADVAISHYKHALQLRPNDAETLCNLAMAQDRKGDLPDAISLYERAKALLSEQTSDDMTHDERQQVLSKLDVMLRNAKLRHGRGSNE